jgi:hypothetical protein
MSSRLDGDTMTTRDLLAVPRSCYYAHQLRTSQAECRGFESRLPLQPLLTDRRRDPAPVKRRIGRRRALCAPPASSRSIGSAVMKSERGAVGLPDGYVTRIDARVIVDRPPRP